MVRWYARIALPAQDNTLARAEQVTAEQQLGNGATAEAPASGAGPQLQQPEQKKRKWRYFWAEEDGQG